jgi:hypothetical protein
MEEFTRRISPAVWCLGRRFDRALHAPMSGFGCAKLYPYHEFGILMEACSIEQALGALCDICNSGR